MKLYAAKVPLTVGAIIRLLIFLANQQSDHCPSRYIGGWANNFSLSEIRLVMVPLGLQSVHGSEAEAEAYSISLQAGLIVKIFSNVVLRR